MTPHLIEQREHLLDALAEARTNLADARKLAKGTPTRELAQEVLAAVHQAAVDLLVAEAEAVDLLRDAGGSWADVGSACGVTRQAAQQRFGGPRPDHTDEPEPEPLVQVADPKPWTGWGLAGSGS